MKKFVLMTMAFFMAVAMNATDVKTVVLQANMSCENCANKIKENVRFEKGVKEIKTNVAEKTVTITYDADKTNVEKLIKGIAKVGYKATEVKGHECCGNHESGKECKGDCGSHKAEGAKADCCKEKK